MSRYQKKIVRYRRNYDSFRTEKTMMSVRVAQPQLSLLCAGNYPVVSSTRCFKSEHFDGQLRKKCNANISSRTGPKRDGPYRDRIWRRTIVCHASRRKPTTTTTVDDTGSDSLRRRLVQFVLWTAEAVYILWLFILPYAPGDPVWAISSETVDSLVGLSLNFFFILPLMNSVGIRVIDAPVLHPMSEGLFNFVIGWTFMFAPLLFTDHKRDRYKGSLDILWGLQMFLTNTFLIPYMAIRLNDADADADADYILRKPSQLASVMTNGAPIVGLIGGAVCLISALWALYGRMDGGFGSITDRWEYLVDYLGSERLAYAFIWDICLYAIFQPWLIGDNLQNIQKSKVRVLNYLRFVPVVGLIAYLLLLDRDREL